MNVKNNARYQENEKKIKDCFIDLINQKDIKSITVGEICRLAEINRTTFYAHFQDIYALLERLEAEMNSNLYATFREKTTDASFFRSKEYFLAVLRFIKEHQNFYRFCLKKRKDFPISEGRESLFQAAVKPNCLIHNITSEDDMMYLFTFYQAGITFIHRRWVENGCKESAEHIADLIMRCLPVNDI